MPEAQTTDEHPILRIAGARKLAAESIAVEDIDTDFESYPDFTELVVDELLEYGQYDDSDGADYTCQFSTDRPEAVRTQWEALKAAHPELWED